MTRLISVGDLLHCLDGPRKPKILDARTAEDYAAGHIPGAINIDSYDLMPEDTSLLGLSAFHEEIDKRHRILGDFEKVEFVIYGNWNDLRACRCLFLMVYSGYLGAALLDGGLEAWTAAGGPKTSEPSPCDRTNFGVRSRREHFARVDEVEQAQADPNTVILDVRDADEFDGSRTPACDPRAGRIPSAKHFPWQRFMTPDLKRFTDLEALRAELSALGLEPKTPIITYCHRGARAAVVWLALRLMGYRKTKNFIGSWHEWSRRHPSDASS